MENEKIYLERMKHSEKLIRECRGCIYSLIDLDTRNINHSRLIQVHKYLTDALFIIDMLQNDSFIKNCFVYGNNCE